MIIQSCKLRILLQLPWLCSEDEIEIKLIDLCKYGLLIPPYLLLFNYNNDFQSLFLEFLKQFEKKLSSTSQ